MRSNIWAVILPLYMGSLTMACGKTTIQYIPCGAHGADVKESRIPCGGTGYDGQQVLCPTCESKGAASPVFEEEAPLSCEDVGNDVYDAHGHLIN
jgi:hypothetical protein